MKFPSKTISAPVKDLMGSEEISRDFHFHPQPPETGALIAAVLSGLHLPTLRPLSSSQERFRSRWCSFRALLCCCSKSLQGFLKNENKVYLPSRSCQGYNEIPWTDSLTSESWIENSSFLTPAPYKANFLQGWMGLYRNSSFYLITKKKKKKIWTQKKIQSLRIFEEHNSFCLKSLSDHLIRWLNLLQEDL